MIHSQTIPKQIINQVQRISRIKVTEMLKQPNGHKSQNSSAHMLDHADLLDYMYQHVQFDEIPFSQDPLYDHRQIYTHENAFMPFGIYEDVQAAVAFEMEIENEKEISHIESSNTAYIHNVGRMACPNDHTCNPAVRTEVYNEEQEEILKMNIENTMRKEKKMQTENDENDKIINREMSQEAPILPVYTPIVDEHHGVMFANSSQALHRQHYEHKYEASEDDNEENELEMNTVRDAETFQYNEKLKDTNIPMVEAAYFTTEKAQKVLFDGEMYAVITYEDGGRLKAIYKNELEIPTAIDNGANVNVLLKAYYDQHQVLQELPKIKANMPPIMTGNGTIPAYFWIDVPLEIQGVMIQLRCIVCESTANHGLLISRLALDQLQAIQLYDKNQLLIKMNAIPIVATQGLSLAPNKRQTIMAQLEATDKNLLRRPIQGKAISWITTNRKGFPLIPVLTEYHNNTTAIAFKKNSEFLQSIKKGQTIGFLDIRSKDGSLAKMQWLIPMNHQSHDYILYGHSFASAIEPHPLATEESGKQLNNRLEIRETPIVDKVKVDKSNDTDPFPWLDKTDPRGNLTDRQILENKIKLENSILNKEQQTEFLDMLVKKREAFSLRDEIGTCPYFEVRLQLRDETPFFVWPYAICEEQKAIVQREMDRLERLGIIEKGLTGFSSPVLLVKRKQQNLYRVVTDFRVLNERLVHINHAFPLVRDCLDVIGNSGCQVFTVIDLRDAYHTLRLAKESQKFCGITPYYGAPTYHYLRMGMGMSCSPGIWGQFADFI